MRLGIWCFFLTLLVGVGACSEKDKPECLISKTELASILSDLHISEKKLDYLNLPSDSAALVYHRLYKKEILSRASYSSDCFEKTMDYYIKYPKEIEDVYRMVVDTLVKRNAKVDSLEKIQEGVIVN